MKKQKIKCPKCNADMEYGYLVDSAHYGIITQVYQSSADLKKPTLLNKQGISWPKTKYTTTYSCVGCGYLESYLESEEDYKRQLKAR